MSTPTPEMQPQPGQQTPQQYPPQQQGQYPPQQQGQQGQHPPQSLVIRPDFTHYRRQVFAAPLLLAAIGAFVIYQSNRSPYGWTVAGVTVVLCIIGIAVFYKRARLVIGPEGITKVGLVGSQRAGWDRMGRILFAPQLSNVDPRLNAALFLLDREDAKIFPMTAPAWSPAQMEEVCRATGLPVIVVPAGETMSGMRKHYPKAIPFYLARPLLLGAVIGVLLLIVIAGGVAVLAATGNL